MVVYKLLVFLTTTAMLLGSACASAVGQVKKAASAVGQVKKATSVPNLAKAADAEQWVKA